MNKKHNIHIYFWIGTIAEYIKLMPIAKLLQEEGVQYGIIATGQNDTNNSEVARFLDKKADILIFDGQIKQNILGVLIWFIRSSIVGFFKLLFSSLQFRGGYLLIHGDTISTMLGAFLGKIFGMKILHVEAGLRSFNWLKPFPEEIDRHIAGRFAHTHYCPNAWSVQNLSSYSGIKINTHYNTIADAMKIALQQEIKETWIQDLIEDKYFFFTIHRQENIYNEVLMKYLISVALEKANNIKCLFVLHAPTKEVLLKLHLLDKITNHENITVMPRVGYFDFTHILANAEFIITDGGSNQEEGYYLGKPTLVLRNETERTEGIGQNVVVSKCSPEVIDNFVKNYESYKILRPLDDMQNSPSKIILESLNTYTHGE